MLVSQHILFCLARVYRHIHSMLPARLQKTLQTKDVVKMPMGKKNSADHKSSLLHQGKYRVPAVCRIKDNRPCVVLSVKKIYICLHHTDAAPFNTYFFHNQPLPIRLSL